MKTVDWRAWFWQYVVPLLIFIASFAVMAWLMSRTGEDLDLLWLFVVFPVLAFGCGLVFQPRRSWVVPLCVVIGMVVVGAVNMYVLGRGAIVRPTPIGFVLAIVFLVGVPLTFLMWVGRSLRQLVGGHAGRHRGPRAPAT